MKKFIHNEEMCVEFIHFGGTAQIGVYWLLKVQFKDIIRNHKKIAMK